ncbi:MAG: tripartite tricarboxylate transporter permease [Alphaproteobacteria bacterium]|nr:tripartite tricarboxylate transporter permease [Alphaproteobacteria bacterium]
MIETLYANLALGAGQALTLGNLLACLAGCLLGTLIGVLPGVGPLTTIALLLPFTYDLGPLGALIMLAGIYYGAQYGGSTTAILVNVPGETASLVTCIDGYRMAQDGRAGAALTIAALGSLFAGIFGTFVLALFGPVLAELAVRFQAPEYFSLMTLGLVSAVVLANGSVLKASAMVFLGLLFGMIGTDSNSGFQRFAFGVPQLVDGVDFLPLVIGLFGLTEVIRNVARRNDTSIVSQRIGRLMLTREEARRALPAVLRGTAIGSVLGILPGGGAVLSAFAAYMVEKKIARDPARFGRGAIEGVAAPESANNSGAQVSFIPLLTLGLPSNAIMALMIGAMMMQGIQPGPEVVRNDPALFWGLVVSMLIGNLMLVVINLPLVGLWVRLLRTPNRFLFPAILVFCCIGIYATSSSTNLLLMAAFFAVFGIVLAALDLDVVPFLLGFVLGPLMEDNLRRAMVITRGDPVIFLQRPICLGLMAMTVALLVVVVVPAVRRGREKAFAE